jgi:ElaB/YqjD/DUF883 family membrane-anchored ribosome-binding protein
MEAVFGGFLTVSTVRSTTEAPRKEALEMSDQMAGPSRDDMEQHFRLVRDDLATLTRLLREVGEAEAGEKRDAVLVEAAALLDKSRSALDEGMGRARQATASMEDHIREKPVQSALIALGLGFLVGMMSRR